MLELPLAFPRVSGGEPGLLTFRTARLRLGDAWEVSDTPVRQVRCGYLVSAYVSCCRSYGLIRVVYLPLLLLFAGTGVYLSLWDNMRKSLAVNLFQGRGSNRLLLAIKTVI